MERSNLINKINETNSSVRRYTQNYFNTNGFFNVVDRASGYQFPFDINDMMLLGALTKSDVLLAGGTGAGKSHFSRMVMNGLYGKDGFVNLTVTPGLNESDFIDIDVPAIKAGKKTIKEALGTTPLLTRPGAIINEINRTPEILQNLFISYLERIFSLKGIEFPVGVPLNKDHYLAQDPHYQFRVISINEGDAYSGTSGIDKAVRDRVVLEIPMDYFAPRLDDIRSIIHERNDSDLTVNEPNGGKLEQILELSEAIKDIPLNYSAKEFLAYMSGMNNCIRSRTNSKKGILFNPKELCEGCHFAKDAVSPNIGNVCGSVYAPSERSLINLKKVAKAVAALRAYKVIDAVSQGFIQDKKLTSKKAVKEYLENLTVTIDDISVIAPFILTGKLPMEEYWVSQNFSGSKYLATENLIKNLRGKFEKFVSSSAYKLLSEDNGVMTPKVTQALMQYSKKEDPWAYSVRDLEKEPVVFEHAPQRVILLEDLL